MKKQILSLMFGFGGIYLSNGQVGIGTTSPNGSSQLEVVAADKGILVPRVALKNTADATTIKNGNINSLLVFNTANSADITPGYYYWFDNKWLRILNADNIPNNIVVWDAGKKQFSYVDKNGLATVFDISSLVKDYETLTSAIFNAATGILTYTDEKGIANSISLKEMVPNFETLTSISQDATAGIITYIDEKGVQNVLDIASIIKNHETLTKAVFNAATGVLTYTDERGIANVISLKEMVPNFETLTSISQDTAGGTITYIDEKGIQKVLDIASIIKNHESLTKAVFNAATGVLTYTDERGIANAISLKEMVPNFETLTSISQDTAVGTITYIDEKGVQKVLDIATIIKSHETLTKADFDPASGVLTYSDEKGVVNSISLKDMVPNFETLTSISQDISAGTITYKDEKGNLTLLSTPSDNVSAGSNKIIIGGTPSGAVLKPFSVDVDESKLTLSNISGKVKNNQITSGTAGQILITDPAGTSTQWVDQSTLVPATSNTLQLTANALKSTVNGVGSTVNFTDSNIVSSKSLTGTDITVTGGNGSLLKDVSLAIKPGSANQILVTNASASGTEWIDQSAVVPATTNTLTSANNILTSNVNGVSQTASLINSNSLALDAANKLVSTVNGVDSPAIDLTAAIASNQKTSSVSNGTNTTVTTTVAGSNSNYIVNTNPATASTIGAVKPGNGLTVDAAGTLAVNATAINTGKSLTSTDLSVTADGATALLKDVIIDIKPNAVTTAKIADATITPTKMASPGGSSKLVLGYDGAGNISWSSVTSVAGGTTVSNSLSGTQLSTTVNGTTGSAVDLTPLVQSGQKTTSVKAASTKTGVTSAVSGSNTEYSVDVNESNLTLSNIGGKVTTSQITSGTANQVLVTNAGGTAAQWINQSSLVPATTNALTLDAANKLVSTVNGVSSSPPLDLTAAVAFNQKTSSVANGANTTVATSVSGNNSEYIINTNPATAAVIGAVKPGSGLTVDGTGTLSVNATAISTGKSLTSTDLSVTSDGATALLKDVSIDIKPNAVTAAKIADATITASKIASPGGSTKLVLGYDGAGNVSWSSVTAVAGGTTVSNTLSGTQLSTTVNGTTGTAVDLTPLVQSGQKTTSVKAASTKAVVTSAVSGSNTEYSVDVNESNLTLSNIGGKVSTAQITNGTANQVLVTNAVGTAAQWVNQSALVPATTNTLTLDAANKLVSTVNGVASSPALDLTAAIAANQKTSSVANGANTTVTTTVSGNNNAYAISTNPATSTVIGAVKPGNGLTVDATGTLAVDALAINTGKALTSTDLSVTSDGATALLKDVSIDIKPNAVTGAKIADGTITGTDIAAKTVTAVNLDAGAGVADRVATANALGVVTYSTIPSTSVVGANVTAASTKVTLGGTPIGAALKAFSVDVNEANLTLTNQIATGSANQVFVVDGSTNKAKWIDQSTLLDNTTVDNGLTKTGNNVKLGGVLTEATVIANNSNALTIATGGSNLSITGLPNTGISTDKIVVTDAAGVLKTIAPALAPKFFYAPSMVMPITNSNLPSYVTYDSASQIYTVDMYLVYNSQFSMIGDVAGASRTALKSTGAGSLEVVASNALGYFVTYFDNTVYDPASITLTADGKLSYKILGSAAITSKTYMNVVFKVL